VLWPIPSSLQVITKVGRLRNTGTTKRKMLLVLYVTQDSISSIFLFVVPVFLKRSTFVITCNNDDAASNNSSFQYPGFIRLVSCQALTVDVAQIIITSVIAQCWVNFFRRFGEVATSILG
jgi:hypothetical protein